MNRLCPLGLLLGLIQTASASWMVGDLPPDFTCDDTAGASWTLSEQRGKVVLVNFGQTGSQPCDSSFAHLQPDFAAVYPPEEFTVVHIDAANESASALEAYWAAYPHEFPVLTQCAELLADWGEGFVPHTVIVDPLGAVQGNWVGFYPAFWDQMHAVVQANLNPTGLYVADLQVTPGGDGDAILEPGESAQLVMELENLGLLPVADVQAILSSGTPYLTVTQETASYNDMGVGGSGVNSVAFQFTVAEGAPEAFDAELQLHLATSLGSAVLRFQVEVGLRVNYWSHDAESSTEEWTHSPTAGWTDAWHLSTEMNHSPTHAWKAGSTGTGNYANHSDCRLVSPPLELRDWSRLSFWHRMSAEVSTAFPDSAYDGGIVEISVDDGGSWTQLVPLTGYNKFFRAQAGSGAPATHNFPGQTPCYSGVFMWEEAVFDLAAYNGLTVRLAFHFGSDNGGSMEGWYVDDLRLAAPDDAVDSTPAPRPRELALLGAWPNPFNPSTQVELEVPTAGAVRLELFDLAGRLVATLHDGGLAAGRHSLRLDGSGLASGLYLLRLETTGDVRSLKLLLVR
jgi:hypothetical protein